MPKNDNVRVVIDTNLFISAVIVKNSLPDRLLTAWRDDKYSLLISHEILEEMQEVSNRDDIKNTYPKFCEKALHLLTALRLSAEIIEPLRQEKLPLHCRDLKDDMLLTLAIGGQADYLVTGDRDLLILHKNPALNDLKIVTAKDFLAKL